MTQCQYGRRAILVSGDVRFQDGDVVNLGKLGGQLSSVFFLSVSTLALAYFNIRYRTTGELWYGGMCDIRVFLFARHVKVHGA